ncbi:DUF4333 domain-containing protein [Mycobacterium sp. CBMA293]|uniref:DUF4333 domain-containing protein n=1 Tax=unclassified Mycolicibacterium TaxID=2636767 RepID=UPI0012DEE477|nr:MULTISPECIES: DUF4333 domain-containing protein [unclassified Mycolicibacterium]MUL47682.1 DUF4333 domain-containing protein [Mycolicibacterium sp. CBMA 360]MUL61800.1 DUF4333 domain-containing protein [Mycolicibacterium sp. CBMA 335]MUL70864.1 DUF4333 domain-containing protein [Mycolicibacterium sp. CBMA 311]MUL92910.1 DUF4333 domain-containing protein [Mycolicibacterium sp. CBMA 230]MUM08649.1 hypothetical protein [Mycolicibacterium sp. CBMA 213]
MRATTTMMAAAAILCVALSGCTVNIGGGSSPSTAKVSKEALQKDISQRLSDAGHAPQSVTCPEDLAGKVGQSTHCEVAMGTAANFEPIVTVTSVDGTTVSYDVTPAVSQAQLEAAVARLVANATKAPPSSVSCQSGLQGKVGTEAFCDVTSAGVTATRTVHVTAVSGLAMQYGLVPMLPKAVVESSLIFQMKQVGPQPDSATCAAGLEGKPGTTVDCTTLTAGQPAAYVLTVTAVQGDNITYKYAPKR